MSVKIVQKSLPSGVVPYEEIADPVMKRKVMLLNRNISSLASQLAELQRAAIELQIVTAKRVEITDPEVILGIAANDATQKANVAKQSAVSIASEDATQKATAAKNEAIQSAAVDANDKVLVHAQNTDIHVTSQKQEEWNAKYDFPDGGIPKLDLSASVQQSLSRADSALTGITPHASTHAQSGTDAITPAAIGAAPAGYVAVGTFSEETYTVYSDTPRTITVNVSRAGYTPVAVINVYCLGTSTGYYHSVRAAFTCSSYSISGGNASLVIDMVSNVGTQPMHVDVTFDVLYLKN